MTDLFRFVALRAAGRPLPGPSIDLSTRGDFQAALSQAVHAGDGHGLQIAHRIAEQYAAGGYGGGFIGANAIIPHADAFDHFAAAAAGAKNRVAVAKAVQDAFAQSAQDVVGSADVKDLPHSIRDTIVAAFILPSVRSYPVADLARLARLLDLVSRVAANDATLDESEVIAAALTETLMLPPAIFPLRHDLPQPVGVGDLLVVKQHLKRYETGDVANIENILRGEKREKTNVHALTMDTTVVTETAKATEQTTSLDVTERFELKTESENVVKEDIAANAGVNVSAKYGAVEMNANANVAYSLSKEQSAKAATDHAKDVTSRAATKVTELVRRQETTRTIEKLKERELHSFDNTPQGSANVSGVYQWLNKVYEAQVFNYGKRLMFDLMVPEPAAFIVDALAADDHKETIVPPEPFVVISDGLLAVRPIRSDDLAADGSLKPGLTYRPLRPSDLAEDTNVSTYYGTFVGKYGAVGVNAPPERTTTVSKAITGNKDDKDHLAAVDDLTIPEGYRASDIAVQGAFTIYDKEDGDERMWVFVGRQKYECKGQGPLGPNAALLPAPTNHSIDEQGSIPVAVETQQARDFAVTVDVTCTRTPAAYAQWQLDTYTALFNAHTSLMGGYHDKVEAQKMQKTTAKSLGQNPTQNRLIERAELQKACIGFLSGTDLYAADFDDISVNAPPPMFPRPSIPPRTNANVAGGDQEAFIRFFEQAFEWEHMMYVFYPYYWARHDRWYESAIEDNADPLFAEFLKAGAARVVVPVRLQLEGDVRYFLMTGQIWGGGAMPEITDTDYLPITEEIKARDDAPGTETRQGDPWEVTLPTTLIQLRSDDTLPIWHRYEVDGHDVWVPGRMQQDKWVPDYGKLHANGTWTPQ